jgi:hypothetical protein
VRDTAGVPEPLLDELDEVATRWHGRHRDRGVAARGR